MIQRGFTTDGTGEKLTPFPTGGGGSSVDTDDQQAVEVPYDNSGSGLTAADVQNAIDELAAQIAAQFSEGDLLSTGEVGGGSGKQDQIYPDFVTPVNGDFAWINQGGASVTVSANNGAIHLIAPANTGHSARIRKKAAPATPYTITAALLFTLPGVDFTQAGLCFRQSSDGKLIVLALTRGNTITDLLIECSDFNSPTSFSVTNASVLWIDGGGIIWLRIADNGTNRVVSYSMDGENFVQLFSEGRTTFMTADEIGFYSNTTTAAQQAACTLLSWQQS